ncbi:T9SS type A sorting domain-containing protein [Bacteroidota bacterium]
MKSKNIQKRKILFFISIFFFLSTGIHAQGITSVSINPQNPTTLDNIILNVDAWIQSGPCWMDSSNVNKVGQNFYVHGYYNSGMLTVICYCSDSITLGYIESGTFTLKYYLHHANYNVPKDSMNITFMVSPMVTVEEKMPSEIITVFPNPADDLIQIAFNKSSGNNEFQIDMLSSSGLLVDRYFVNVKQENFQIHTSALPAGLYFLKISDKYNVKGLTKISILR